MSNSTPVKDGLIPAVIQMMNVWFVNNGCNFMKFVERCFIPCVLPYGSDVTVDVRFKFRRWGETGLHVGSAGSIGSRVTRDADMAR